MDSVYVGKSYQLIVCRLRLIYYPFLNSTIFWLHCLLLVEVGRGELAITHMNTNFVFKHTNEASKVKWRMQYDSFTSHQIIDAGHR